MGLLVRGCVYCGLVSLVRVGCVNGLHGLMD